MKGKVCIVTGANSGVGLMTALGLAARGAHIFLACRSEAKARNAIDFIKQRAKTAKVEYLPLDLASLESIYTCVAQFKNRNLSLHVLVNNAGIFFGEGVTHQGINRIFSVNYLGHFVLTYLLLENMRKADACRIIMVSSDTVYKVRSIDWNLMLTEIYGHQILSKFNNTFKVYSFSKVCMLLLMVELVRQLQIQNIQNITVNAVHPGFVQSNISLFHRFSKVLGIGISPSEGAKSSIFCATALELQGISGKFLGTNCQEMKLPELANDRKFAAELWERSLSLLQVS